MPVPPDAARAPRLVRRETLRIERERTVLGERPVPCGRPERANRLGTMAAMRGAAAPNIELPWIPFVGPPPARELAWLPAGAVRHRLCLSLVVPLIALQ